MVSKVGSEGCLKKIGKIIVRFRYSAFEKLSQNLMKKATDPQYGQTEKKRIVKGK